MNPGARTCDTTIEVMRPRDGDPFSEQHRQYFHSDEDVRASLRDANFALSAVSREYTHEPVDASTLRATWTARRRPMGASTQLASPFLLADPANSGAGRPGYA